MMLLLLASKQSCCFLSALSPGAASLVYRNNPTKHCRTGGIRFYNSFLRHYSAKTFNSRRSRSSNLRSSSGNDNSSSSSSISSSSGRSIQIGEFGSNFRLPERDDSEFLLQRVNSHPLDARISFDEAAHSYSFDSKPLPVSVTAAVSSFFDKFEAAAAVQRMISGRNWPREEYIHRDSGVPFTAQEVMLQWEQIGEQARNRGSWMHLNIERTLNNLPPYPDTTTTTTTTAAAADTDTTTIATTSTTSAVGISPELQQFYKFRAERLEDEGIRPYRTEWRIAAPDLGLAGSVDFVGLRGDSSSGFVIMDWKRSKKLPISMYTSYGRKARPPLSHLPDCDGSKYALQLNLYRYILRTYYALDVRAMTLVSFHPDFSDFFAAEIPIMDREVQVVVAELKDRFQQQQLQQQFR